MKKENNWETIIGSSVIALIAIVALAFLIAVFNSNDKEPPKKPEIVKDYTTQTVDTLNSLKSPVILIGKSESFGLYSVTLKDATGKIVYFGDMSGLANDIGETRQINDTIK